MKFRVNDQAPGDVFHEGARCFRKGIVYDSEAEKIPAKRLSRMLSLKIGEIPFFAQVTENKEG